MNDIHITVVLPTHSPRPDYLRATCEGLRQQSLPCEEWELLIIDNASDPPVDAATLGISDAAFPMRIVRETQLGLTLARQRGIREARGEIIIFVDDDNVLDRQFLNMATKRMQQHPNVGICGGKVVARFESEPPEWIEEFLPLLACQDFGRHPRFSGPFDGNYPEFSPVGAGMVIRAELARHWNKSPSAQITDRSGDTLTSGGDNDLVLSVLKSGFEVGWFPELRVEHLIPAQRTTPEYLARLNFGIQKSWMQLNTIHQINPWPPISPWSLPFRIAKAWLTHHGWESPVGWIRWKGACGHFQGRVTHRTPADSC